MLYSGARRGPKLNGVQHWMHAGPAATYPGVPLKGDVGDLWFLSFQLAMLFQAGELIGIHRAANLQQKMRSGLLQIGASLRDAIDLREKGALV